MADANKDVIKVRVENVIAGAYQDVTDEVFDEQVGMLPSQKASQKQNAAMFTGAISAQMFLSSLGQIVGATGNQALGSFISQGAEIGFTAASALTGNVPAMFSLLTKGLAMLSQELVKHKQEMEELANKYNDVTMLKLQTGQISINANTVISYDKYNKVTFNDRK